MSNYCKIFFSDGSSLVVAKVLAWFENKLGADFCRIHRSYLVNRHHICSLKTNHYPKVVLTNGDELSVSKRKKHAVKVLMLG
jgi:two-component system LytT family response regulator